MIDYELHLAKEGEGTKVWELVLDAVERLPELTWQSTRSEADYRIRMDIEANQRFEIIAKDGQKVVGGAVITLDDDCQLGELVSVQWCYVLPEYRGAVGRKIVRLTRKVASCTDCKVMAFTHRISEGRYEINYRKMEGQDGQED